MKNDTPRKAMRMKCLECSGGSVLEVRECPIKKCTLYPYRLGKRPDKENTEWISDGRAVRVLSEEEKAALRERIRKMHEKRRNSKEQGLVITDDMLEEEAEIEDSANVEE